MSKVKSVVAGTVMCAIAGLGGCHTTDSHVTWQPSGVPHHDHPYQEWWSYKFVYFPQEQVYFEPYTGEFYWFDNGQWERGMELPFDMHVDPAEGMIVKLQHQQPYRQHETVLKWCWPYNHPPQGSLDSIHHSDEAVVLMEKRQIWRESGIESDSTWTLSDWPEPDAHDADTFEAADHVGSVSDRQPGAASEMVTGVDSNN